MLKHKEEDCERLKEEVKGLKRKEEDYERLKEEVKGLKDRCQDAKKSDDLQKSIEAAEVSFGSGFGL